MTTPIKVGWVRRKGGAPSGGPLLATAGGWSAATCFAIALGGVLPFLFTPVSVHNLSDPAVVLAYAVLLYAALRLSFVLLKGVEALIDATFWIFVYVFFGLAALAQTAAQRYALPPYGPFTQGDQLGAFASIIVGITAYEIGRLLARSARTKSSSRPEGARYLAPKRVWGLAAIGLLSLIGFVLTEGLPLQFSSRQDSTVSLLGAPAPGQRLDQISDKAVGIIKVFFHWAPAFVALYLLLYLQFSAREHRLRIPWVTTTAARMLLASLIVANVVLNNPISNPRSRFGGVTMALAVAVIPLRKAIRFRTAITAVVVALLFIFPLADLFRYSERGYRKAAPLGDELVSSADYSMFQQELNAQVYVKDNGHTFGRQALGSIFVFVPRRWWPSKPIATGDLISRTNAINASDSLWAEAYVDAGYIGVVIFFLFYGRVTGKFEQAYMQRQSGSLSIIGVVVPLFAAFQLLILRGALQPVVGELAPVFLVILACSQRREGVVRVVQPAETTVAVHA